MSNRAQSRSLPPTTPHESSTDPRDVIMAMWDGGADIIDIPDSGSVIVGRDILAGGLFVNHPTVSSRHARIDVAGGVVSIVDTGSRNGVKVSGHRISAEQPIVMEPGVFVEIGAATLVVQRGWVGSVPRACDAAPSTPRSATVPSRPPSSGVLPVVAPGPHLPCNAAIARIAPSDLPVLILGETGVGKDVAARQIHAVSKRTGRFVALNCATLTGTLLESELFGHEKGAFTGAGAAKPGMIELADGGTLFLDELREMPLDTQGKFLRVLQDGVVRRLGSVTDRKVGFRPVCATNGDLDAAIQAKAFRADLFHRVQGFTIKLPPLRERREEILPLAMLFLERTGRRAKLTKAAERALLRYAWPGNIRELELVVNRAAVMAGGPMITPDDLGLPVEIACSEEERRHIVAVFEQCNYNQKRTAAALGIARGTLITRLKAWGMLKNNDPR